VRYDAEVRLALMVAAVVLVAGAGPAAPAEIGQLSVTPMAPPPGTAITLTFELRNPERRPLPAGVVDVRALGKSIGHVATPGVPAGGSVTVSGGVTLPSVTDKTLRLALVPPAGPALAITLTLTPR